MKMFLSYTTRMITFVTLLAVMITPLVADAAQPERPNIIFIYADDWGWGDLSSHGNTWLDTPNLDRLADEGIDFQQFNVVSPVCSPSRVAVMTGHYPARYCIHQHFATPASNRKRGMPDWLDPNAPSLPRLLQQAGYRTAHFGKWHLTNRQTEGAPTPDAYGYDEAHVFNGGAGWPSADLDAAGPDAVAFIEKHKDKPFFLNVWLHETHLPHVPSQASMDKWKHLDPQRRVYAAVVSDGDNAVGQILDALEKHGLEKNTIVMFSSDNGPEWTRERSAGKKADRDAGVKGYDGYYSVGETGGLRGKKRSMFEGGVRTPFILRWPGHAPAGMEDKSTVLTAVDLLPTLCAAAGVDLPEGYEADGESLLDAFKGKPVLRTKPIYWAWRGTKKEPDHWPRLAVRDSEWKLYLAPEANRAELYRLPEDRNESNNLAEQHPEVVRRLSKLALDWQATLPDEPDPDCRSNQALPSRDAESLLAEKHFPAFSWDRVPVYAHVGKASGDFTENELVFLAKHFDFITIEKGQAALKYGHTEKGFAVAIREIKKRNPDAKVLYYWNASLESSTVRWGYEAAKTLPEGGLLKDREGKPVLRRGQVPNYDHRRADVRDWWSDAAERAVREFGADGIFADAMGDPPPGEPEDTRRTDGD